MVVFVEAHNDEYLVSFDATSLTAMRGRTDVIGSQANHPRPGAVPRLPSRTKPHSSREFPFLHVNIDTRATKGARNRNRAKNNIDLTPSQHIKMSHVAPIYRLMLLHVEPFMAFYGAVMAARSPILYLSVMSPAANLSHYNPAIRIIFDQLAGTYLLFAFNQAIVLRVAEDNLRVWRAMISGMVLCDLAHIAATARAFGGWAALVSPAAWRGYDWVNVVTLLGMTALRLAFLAGWGVHEAGSPAVKETKAKAKTG